jgi:hypothetical protein
VSAPLAAAHLLALLAGVALALLAIGCIGQLIADLADWLARERPDLSGTASDEQERRR